MNLLWKCCICHMSHTYRHFNTEELKSLISGRWYVPDSFNIPIRIEQSLWRGIFTATLLKSAQMSALQLDIFLVRENHAMRNDRWYWSVFRHFYTAVTSLLFCSMYTKFAVAFCFCLTMLVFESGFQSWKGHQRRLLGAVMTWAHPRRFMRDHPCFRLPLVFSQSLLAITMCVSHPKFQKFTLVWQLKEVAVTDCTL